MLQIGPRELLLNMSLTVRRPHPWAGGTAYVVGVFDRLRITLHAQQTRALNLVYALAAEGRLTRESQTVIVGAGPAGLTAAAAIARLGLGRVVIIDKGKVLGVFAPKDRAEGRFVTPFMSEWPHSHWFVAKAGLPVLNWEAAMSGTDDEPPNRPAGDKLRRSVGSQLHAGFEQIAKNSKRLRVVEKARARIDWDDSMRRWAVGWDGIDLFPRDGDRANSCHAHNLILAFGFGSDERKEDDILKHTPSYWHGLPKASGAAFWLAGDGDGALADAISHAVPPRGAIKDPYENALKLVSDWLIDVDRSTKAHALVDRFWEMERQIRTGSMKSHEMLTQWRTLATEYAGEFAALDLRLWPSINLLKRPLVHLVLEGPHVLSHERFGVNRLLLWRAIEQGIVETHLFRYPGGKRVEPLVPKQHLPDGFAGFMRLGPDWPLKGDFKDLAPHGGNLSQQNLLDLTRFETWPEGFFDAGPASSTEASPSEIQLKRIRVEATMTVAEESEALPATSSDFTITYEFANESKFLMEHRVSPAEPFRLRVTSISGEGITIRERHEPWCVAYEVEGKAGETRIVRIRGNPDGLLNMSDCVGIPIYGNMEVAEIELTLKVCKHKLLRGDNLPPVAKCTLLHRRAYLEVTGQGFQERPVTVTSEGHETTYSVTFTGGQIHRGYFHQIGWSRIVPDEPPG